MAVTFDGPNKLIICSTGTVQIEINDVYSRWKDWVAISDHAKYLQAFSAIGGDPLTGGQFLGSTYFLENGWKVRPQEANHVLVVKGNLYARDGSSPFVSTTGTFNVRIEMQTSNLIDQVSTGAAQPGEIWSHVVEGTFTAEQIIRIMRRLWQERLAGPKAQT